MMVAPAQCCLPQHLAGPSPMVVDKQPMDDSEVARETPEAQAAPSSSGSDAGKPAWLTPNALLLQQSECILLLSTNADERSARLTECCATAFSPVLLRCRACSQGG